MSLKRKIQHLKRFSKSFLTKGKLNSSNIISIEQDLSVACPEVFETAIFNFTIDFELIWGNGKVEGKEHSFNRREDSAKRQAECFFPFTEMLKELNFPITWAPIGKLADPGKEPSSMEKFNPSWSENDWYDGKYKSLSKELWDGRSYLKHIKENFPNHEVKSHGFAHIDYGDSSTTEDIASWDMRSGIESLRNFGFDISGLVYPCNKHGHFHLLKENNINIIRGEGQSWNLQTSPIQTPLGFWVSPAFMSLKEAKKLLDLACINRSFFHPWMHLVECDLAQNDISEFYRPLFEYVLELESQDKLKNMSFLDIYTKVKNKCDLSANS